MHKRVIIPNPLSLLLWACFMLSLRLLVPATLSAASASAGLEQHTGRDDVHLILRIDRQAIGVVDPLRLSLHVEAPETATVLFPEPGASLGPFQVARILPRKPQAAGPERQQWQQEYILTTEQPGTLTLPALTVQVRTAAGDIALSTEPLDISVTSLLTDHADVQAPRDIAPPVPLERRGVPPWVWIALGGLAGLLLLLAAWWLWRRRHHRFPIWPPRPAHVLALEALQRLQRDDLIAQWRVEEFYVRLSGIVRRYIEWRFGVRAPEQTTEEFLEAIFTTGGLIATHRDLLAAFLQQCDLVKFAMHQPVSGDMQRALERARAFIEQTADASICVAVAQEGEACV